MKYFTILFLLGAALIPQGLRADDPNIFVGLAKKTVPSVVNISTQSTIKARSGSTGPSGPGSMPNLPEEFFKKFFEDYFGQGGDAEHPDLKRRPKKAVSLGSGFIIDGGLVLTNNHVVAGADEIKIYFTEDENEKPSDGEIVGRDLELDLALIKVKTERTLTPIPLGDSGKLQVGEMVMAVGNPFGEGHSVSHGIISAKERSVPDLTFARYLQTDAPINPGNSGGPLVNLKGEVIGINNAIRAGAQGIGFAIPIDAVKEVLPQLKSKGSVTRGYIGVGISELTEEIAPKVGAPKDLKAPFVTQVAPQGPGEKAGLKPYDVILELDGKKVKNGEELVRVVTAVPVDQTVKIKFLRSGKEMTLSIKIGKRPTGDEDSENKSESKKEKSSTAKPKIETGMKLQSGKSGLMVAELEYDSPADEAGIMRGDIILEVDKKPVHSTEDFYSIVKEHKAYLLRVKRSNPDGGDEFTVILLDLSKPK